jgi:hypothetical protein
MLEFVAEPYRHWLFTSAHGDQLRVVPERGGLVTGWACGGRERLYLDQQRFADPANSVRGGIPVLFPICSSLPGNRLDLPQGSFAMNQHGFARDLPWQLRALEDGRGIELTVGHSDVTLAQYPFPPRAAPCASNPGRRPLAGCPPVTAACGDSRASGSCWDAAFGFQRLRRTAQPPPTSAATSRTIAQPGLTSHQTRAAPMRTGDTANTAIPGCCRMTSRAARAR